MAIGSILPAWISRLDLAEGRFNRGDRAGKLGMGAGLDHGLGLGQVLGGIDDGGFEPVPGLVEAAGRPW